MICLGLIAMNTSKITIVIPRQRRRVSELYSSDLPFQPRREKIKTVYSRRAKHKNQSRYEYD